MLERSYTPNGGVASPSLITAIIQDNGPWAHAVLEQCFAMSESVRNALLKGEAKWQIPNAKTLIITLAESQ